MRKALVLISLFLWGTAAVAQQHVGPVRKGTIYGVVIGQDRLPARRIGLTAWPLGGPLGARLPHTTTSDTGEYRFENLPWLGRYTVYAEDEEAGYSVFATTPAHPEEVEITPERPEAEFRLYLPPPAGFLTINLSNQETGAAISAMMVEVRQTDEQRSLLFTIGCSSTRVLLIPPDRDLLLHVSADGFREWQGSIGKGKAIYLASGARLKMDVQLVPIKE